jgi:protein-S-isoprenylcysteine O-methyltransferase Ste14
MAVWYAAILFSVADFRLLIEFLRLHTTIMYHGPAWINYSCLVFFAGGAWLRYLIVQTLRRHDAPDRPIEAGPFRVLRYPLYTAFLLQLFSIIFFFGSGGGLLLVLLGGIPLVLREIAREERENEEEFGHAFVEYKSRTKRLVPFIW